MSRAVEESVLEGIEKLSLGSNSRTDALKEELSRTHFTIFEPKADLGYFGWRPDGRYRSIGKASAGEILDMMELDARPDQLVDVKIVRSRLPKTFASLPPQKHMNKFPNDVPHIASLHVASKSHDYDLETLDFILGGSALEVLANNEIPEGSRYIAVRVPSTNAVIVRKHKEYEQDFADAGFQFERLVIGKEMSDRQELFFVEHLHVCQVGKFSILFSAEVDAEQDGLLVEVKANNPRYWGTKVLFQMLSSGSTKLCHGQKSRGRLTGVTLKSLSQIAKIAVTTAGHASVLEQRIVANMEVVQESISSFSPGTVLELSFRGNKLTLSPPREEIVVLPSDEVVHELLSK